MHPDPCEPDRSISRTKSGLRPTGCARSRHKLIALAPAAHASGRGRGEMGHAHHRGLLAKAVEYLASGLAGLPGVAVAPHAKLGITPLNRRMDHVARDERVPPRTANQHRVLIDGVTRRGNELN